MTHLRDHYENVLKPELTAKFGYANPMRVPRLDKIVVNMGVGEASQDRKKIEGAVEDLTLISGQRPVITKAKKSIAAFKLRDGMIVGAKVTLRRDRMYEFLDRLVNVALPRVRDFRGLSPKSFDGRGNFALGLKEQIVFQEIDYDKVDQIRGLDVVICTTAETDDEARELLRGFKLPITGRALDEEGEEEKEEAQAEDQDAAAAAPDDADASGVDDGEPSNGDEK